MQQFYWIFVVSTAIINCNADIYLVFALTHTDPKTCKASADVAMMWMATSYGSEHVMNLEDTR